MGKKDIISIAYFAMGGFLITVIVFTIWNALHTRMEADALERRERMEADAEQLRQDRRTTLRVFDADGNPSPLSNAFGRSYVRRGRNITVMFHDQDNHLIYTVVATTRDGVATVETYDSSNNLLRTLQGQNVVVDLFWNSMHFRTVRVDTASTMPEN